MRLFGGHPLALYPGANPRLGCQRSVCHHGHSKPNDACKLTKQALQDWGLIRTTIVDRFLYGSLCGRNLCRLV